MDKLEIVQYQAAFAVTGAWQGSNCSKLNEWETLSGRRIGRRILQIHKIMNNKTPSYLKDKLPSKHRPFFSSPLFNVEDFPSFDSLKDHVLSLVRPVNKSIFGVHDPLDLRYLFQLRVRLNPLRSHKSRHNFIDTPSDICHCKQGVEDTSHFLFFCSSYVTQRASLTSCVSEILLKNNLNHLENHLQLYLYGHDSINYADNRKILLSTLKYIKRTLVVPQRKFCSLLDGRVRVGGRRDMLPLIFSCSIYVCCCINYFHLISVLLFEIN